MSDDPLRGLALEIYTAAPEAIGDIVARHGAAAIARAHEEARTSLVPLNQMVEWLESKSAQDLRTRLKPIAAKVAPHLSPSQGSAWLDAMMLALSDLPARIVVAAAGRTIHVPVTALWEVEKAIRDEAAVMIERQRAAVRLLREMLDQIQRAAAPAHPQLAAPESVEPISDDEIRAMPAHMRSLGLSKGWITQDALDRLGLSAEEPEDATNG